MLDIKDLEVGKTYRHVAGDLHPSFEFTKDVFTVSSIDEDGDVATLDSTWRGSIRPSGWFITDNSDTLAAENGILKFEEVVE
jgi:alkylhydroperoxidase family enzyme